MRGKLTFISGFATGYLLGSKAGRGRYEQIRQATRSFASNPTVQSTAATIQDQATGALGTAKDKASGRVSDKWQEKKPAWLGSRQLAASSGSSSVGMSSTGVAGSNGQV